MSKYSKLIKDTAIFGIGNFTTKLIYFFLMPIYTLSLSTKDFGIADLLNNSLQLVIPIFTISISDAVFRFSLDKDVKHEELLANGLKVLSWSYIIVAILLCFVSVFNLDYYWYIFGILYVTESIKSLFAQFTRGLGKVKEYAINGIIAAVVLLISTYIFLRIINLGIEGYLLAFVVANIFASIYLLFVVGIKTYIRPNLSNKVLLRGMIAFSLPLTPNMLSWWITNISSRYIIAFFSGFSVSGLFAAASKIPALINVISSIFQLSWQFASVKEFQESQKSEFYSVVLKYYTCLIIVTGSIIISLIPWISIFILKGDFYDAWVYTPLLLFSAVLGCYSIFFGTFYAVVKENKKAMITTFIGSGVNLIICFISIPFIGIIGALIANVISYAIIVYLRILDSKKYVDLNVNWIKISLSLTLLLLQSSFMMINGVYRLIAYCLPILFLFIYLKDYISLYHYITASITNKFVKN